MVQLSCRASTKAAAMKILAIAMVLAAFAPAAPGVQEALNTAANTVFAAAGSSNRQATKVVPVVRPGGGNGGFAQIVGSSQAVKATTAVMEITTTTAWSITALIPVSRIDSSSGSFHREYGVAVDALVNYRSL